MFDFLETCELYSKGRISHKRLLFHRAYRAYHAMLYITVILAVCCQSVDSTLS